MIRYSIAIVDDEETIRDSLELILSDEYDVRLYEDAESFVPKLDKLLPDIILMDIGLPGISGIQALEIVKSKTQDLPVIMVTAYEDINMVIKSMKIGAYDFILKPINPDILELTIKKAIASIALIKEVKLLQEKYLKENEPCFIGESQNIENIMDFIDMVSKSSDTPVMVLGETGTGKELIARAIHARSPVFQGPFVAINCSAFPEDLIESELFGYEPGAFSGAKRQGKKGMIEIAANGTLFLDEVADLSPAGQAKLLRFLESGKFYKVGGTKEYRIKTRVVSATNKDIQVLVEKEKFRKDLFFRLCVVKASIPSLNDRKEDIVPLAKHFLYEYNQKFSKKIKGFSDQAWTLLLSHSFTGNVRELKNIIERAVLISKDKQILDSDLGLISNEESLFNNNGLSTADIHLAPEGIDLSIHLTAVEKKYMAQAMVLAKGNESQAARLLNMNHHTFRYRWKKYH
ncbi:MAG: sigma-54 dependent transcriptional regulator [Desulfobacula sp.]|nr:sigma-54 dependent transcriptional regulator [Desulfobacula sp.]